MKLGLVSRIAELIVKKVMGKAEQNSRRSRCLFAPCDPITWGDARPAGLAAIDAPWGVRAGPVTCFPSASTRIGGGCGASHFHAGRRHDRATMVRRRRLGERARDHRRWSRFS